MDKAEVAMLSRKSAGKRELDTQNSSIDLQLATMTHRPTEVKVVMADQKVSLSAAHFETSIPG